MNNLLTPLSVSVYGSMFDGFADLTRDNNPIHRSKEAAASLGFRDTPAQGAYLIACFEQLAAINGFGFNHYSIKFKSPAFPGDRLCFNGRIGDSNLSTKAINQDSEVIATCSISTYVFREYIPPSGKLIRSLDYGITQDDVDSFHKLLHFRGNEFPNSLVGSLIPASLLDIVSEDGGKPIGIFRGVDVSSFDPLTPCKYKVDIFNEGEPRKISGAYVYDFMGVCNKANTPALSGRIKVISPQELKI